eukprot:PhM_4_TR10998/c0_g1_i1/m.29185
MSKLIIALPELYRRHFNMSIGDIVELVAVCTFGDEAKRPTTELIGHELISEHLIQVSFCNECTERTCNSLNRLCCCVLDGLMLTVPTQKEDEAAEARPVCCVMEVYAIEDNDHRRPDVEEGTRRKSELAEQLLATALLNSTQSNQVVDVHEFVSAALRVRRHLRSKFPNVTLPLLNLTDKLTRDDIKRIVEECVPLDRNDVMEHVDRALNNEQRRRIRLAAFCREDCTTWLRERCPASWKASVDNFISALWETESSSFRDCATDFVLSVSEWDKAGEAEWLLHALARRIVFYSVVLDFE